MSTFTTHLICVPELDETASVSAVHILPGHHVHSNTPLLTLICGDSEIEICAPEAGLVSHIMVEIKESVQCGDLLLQMEIEEEPVQLFGAEATFASACQLDWPAAQTATLNVSLSAARLAAKLGVDLSTITAQGECIEEADIEAHVRAVMLQWQQSRPY
ncbi:biotin/lipoyl-containing protein [Iodobacter fluviatilis]|uniref:Biotin-dependent enzyme n=1 Tax=Iodobacter fluviatilis TaxID=537 RepID=A0A377SRN7_9NEIS|nr:biotin/lipoyl-containing protein [Iodobacter fluviatilis]TCU86291.1 biotin-dependent enzyme [Iodobacter fluviatilis]STR44702.1 dihydrolipoamide acetyltransferase [Iodobacter fluviatilis]